MKSDGDLNGDRDTLEMLERSLPRVVPPDDFFDRILAEIQPEATVLPFRERHRFAVPVAAAVAAVAAAIVIAVVALQGDGPATAEARAAITGKSDPAVTGEAALYGSDAAGGTIRIALSDVPPAPSGRHYEVWVLRRDAGAEMEAVGSFTPVSSTVELDLPLPGPGDYAAVDISVEEDGGPPAHSETSLATGTFG